MSSFGSLGVLLFFLSLILPSSTCSASMVEMTVHYEALCPFCADFIINRLSKLFHTGLISAVELRLIPWGNSLLAPDGSTLCQHGAAECMLNTIEACSIYTYPDVDKHFNFINCTEVLAIENRLNEWVSCLTATGLSNAPVDCYRSGYGNVLEQRYAAETSELNPPHRFVPWVLVNNQPLQEDYQNFLSYICKAYESNLAPEACRRMEPEASTVEAQDGVLGCYAHKEGKLRSGTETDG